eukprot:XP_015570944.1 uncharacterized protein LOC8280271 isoform X1 [Ricinus communis]
MASEKPNQGDKSPKSTSSPQSNEEFASLHPLNRAVDDDNSFDHAAYPVPYLSIGGMYEVPQPYEQDMSYFPITENDIGPFNVSAYPETGYGYFYEPVSDLQSLVGNVNEFGQHDAPGALAAERNIITTGTDMAGGLQMPRTGEEANANDICTPWLIGNQGTYAGSPHLSSHSPSTRSSQLCRPGGEANGSNISRQSLMRNQFFHSGTLPVSDYSLSGGELRMNNNVMRDAAQSNHPEALDGKTLTLGIGCNVETRSEHKVSSKDSNQSTKRIVLPTVNTSSGQNIARSFMNSSSNMASGFSSFQNFTGGFSRLALNESLYQTQNPDAFSSLGQNAGGVSYPARNLNRLSSLGQNAGGVYHDVKNANKFSSLVQNSGGFLSLTQNVDGFSHQAQNIDRSSGVVQNVDGFSKPSINETGRILSLQVDEQNLHIPSRGNSGLGEKRVERFVDVDNNASSQGFPTNSSIPHISNEVGNTPWFIATGMPSSSQDPHIGAVRNFSPIIGVTRNRAGQDQSAGHHVSKVSAAQAAECGPLCKNGVQPDSNGNHHLSQALVSVNPSKSLLGPPHTTDIPAVNVPAQYSSISPEPCRKRAASASPSDVTKAPRTKTRVTKPRSHLSTAALAQTGVPDAPLAPVNSLSPRIPHTIRCRPPLSYTSSHLPSLARTSPLRYVKHQAKDEKTLVPSGNKCYICNRDLSFTPEGPIDQPKQPIPVAVLPCGHHFHDSCLQRITPEDQAQDPPCIPCAIGDKN